MSDRRLLDLPVATNPDGAFLPAVTAAGETVRYATELLRGDEGPQGDQGPAGATGPQGQKGWSPIFAAVVDGERRVLRVVDWQGGEGTKPATGKYVGAAGLVDALADGVDTRGPTGAGDMDKAVYDSDDDGKVDAAELADTVAWGGVTGKPGTYPPDDHGHNPATPQSSGFMSAADKDFLDTVQGQLNDKLDDSQRGTAHGVASLGSDGKVPTAQLPSLDGGGWDLIVVDEAAAGTSRASSAGSQKRTLNTVRYNNGKVAHALASNNVTVNTAGTYVIEADGPAVSSSGSMQHMLSLDIDGAKHRGTSEFVSASSASRSFYRDVHALAAGAVLSVYHLVSSANPSNGLGQGYASSGGETFTRLFLRKVA